jgi:[ribosomal protein S5]-alanine N-acetyltransferase
MPILETERLYLDEVSVADAAFILALVNTPIWLQYIGDRGIHTLEDAEKYITNVYQKSYQNNKFGLYKLTLKNSKTPIGLCGLVKRDYLDFPDIGFALMPDYEKKGYGQESATTVLEYATNTLHFPTILAITTPTNTPSQYLLKKIGFQFDKNTRNEKDEELLVFLYNTQNLL